MTVVYLIGSLNLGGTETLLLDLFENCNKSPFKMYAIYRKDGVLSKRFNSTKIPIFKIETGPFWLIWMYIINLRRSLKKLSPDLIHTNQGIDTIYARIASLGMMVKIVQSTHEFDFKYSVFMKLLKSVSFKCTNHDTFVSNSLKEYYELHYKLRKDKISVIHNAVNIEKFSRHTNCTLRNQLGLNAEKMLLGMVGNFVPGHDQATICRFLALLKGKDIDFFFVFIGSKDNNNPGRFYECVDLCNKYNLNNNVLFLGSRSDVPELLPQLDAFLYSSDHDSFGIAVIEAIITGIPVFVNDWKVMNEITENGKRAILFQSKNENDLLEKFMLFIKQPDFFRKQAIKNANWASITYNIQDYMIRLNDVYGSLI